MTAVAGWRGRPLFFLMDRSLVDMWRNVYVVPVTFYRDKTIWQIFFFADCGDGLFAWVVFFEAEIYFYRLSSPGVFVVCRVRVVELWMCF